MAQTAVWHHEMVVRKRERKLIFQVVLVFREGIDLPSHPSGLLAYRHVRAGGAVLFVAEVVGAYSMTKTDTAGAITLLVFALAAAPRIFFA